MNAALQRDITALTFDDNSYLDEAFISKCVAEGFAGWYDQAFVEQQVDFVLRRCSIPRGARVLDAACGHGKHSEALARRGYRVLGTDVSSTLIAHLSQKGIAGADFQCMRFAQMSLPDEFGLAIVLGNSLGLIPRSEFQTAVCRLAASLTARGYLFTEMDNRPYFISHEAGRKTWSCHAGDRLVFSNHYYDPDARLEKTMDISIDLNDGSIQQFLLTKSLYDYEELLGCFRIANLEIESVFGDWNGKGYKEQSPSILVVSRRAF